MIIPKKLNLVGRVFLSGLALLGGAKLANADSNDGCLKIENNLNSHDRHMHLIRDDVNFPGAIDGYDGWDNDSFPQQPLYPDIYSNITAHTLWDDFRAEDSNVPYDIGLFFKGSLPSNQSNWLEFSLPYDGVVPYGEYKFGNKPILFQSGRMPYGPVVDVRRAINDNDGNVPLIEAVAGTSGEYGTGELDIGTRILGDTSDSGHVDLGDFALIAMDWEKGPGQYVGDIAGPNGIPDGYVNYHDISALSDDYLKSL